MTAQQDATTRLLTNVGAADTTAPQRRDGFTRELANVGAALTHTETAIAAVGWGLILTPGSTLLPPTPEGATRLYLNVT